MNAVQLLKQIVTNRNLILRNNLHAYEALQMLKSNYAQLANEEITLNLELNNTLAELHFNSNYAGAIDNSTAVVDKFKNSVYKSVIALHLKAIGHGYIHTGEFDLAERYFLEALKHIIASDPDYIENRSGILLSLAMNEDYREGEYEKAIGYLTEAIELQSAEKHAVGRASSLMGLGNVYNSIENVEEALKHYLEAVVTLEQNYVLPGMANAYSNIGNCYLKLNDLEKAQSYHEKALQLRMKSGTPDDISISYSNMAIVYKEKNDFDRAEECLVKSKKILEDVGNKPWINYVNEMLDELAQLRRDVTGAPLPAQTV
jgi:tetratricopeptide (TPR) repeat protein